MTSRTRTQRLVRWCRIHPRATAVIVGATIVLGVIGEVRDKPKDDQRQASADAPSVSASAPPATKSTSIRTSTAPSASKTPERSLPARPQHPTVVRLSLAPADRDQASSRSAVAVLATIAIKGRASRTGYVRSRFGSAWTDDNDNPSGRNGCDTRNDILRRDLTKVVIKPGSNGCAVLTGQLRDPYTNAVIAFRRGQATSSRVQIDHVVSLGDAWQKGAQRYDEHTRVNFANDPLNLLAVAGSANSAKGDGDVATWLPPNTAYRCAYVARQIAVKERHQLSMTAAEHDAVARVLRSCPQQPVPTESGTVKLTLAPKPIPAPKTTSYTPPPLTTAPPSDVYYANCDAVRDAGAAPIYRGDPGYASHLDRDGDGVGCE